MDSIRAWPCAPGPNGFDSFTNSLLDKRAAEAKRRRIVPWSQHDDIVQDLALDLVRRRRQFDARRGNWEAFATVVTRHRLESLREESSAQSRNPNREVGSLNIQSRTSDGQTEERSAQLADSCHDRRLGRCRHGDQDQADLRSDLQKVLAGLPTLQREICERLARDTVAGVARDLAISRVAVYAQIAEIRLRFEQANLRDYL